MEEAICELTPAWLGGASLEKDGALAVKISG